MGKTPRDRDYEKRGERSKAKKQLYKASPPEVGMGRVNQEVAIRHAAHGRPGGGKFQGARHLLVGLTKDRVQNTLSCGLKRKPTHGRGHQNQKSRAPFK